MTHDRILTLKGSTWKGPFHLPRMQLECWQTLEELSTGEAPLSSVVIDKSVQELAVISSGAKRSREISNVLNAGEIPRFTRDGSVIKAFHERINESGH
jgi:hypothetical protein